MFRPKEEVALNTAVGAALVIGLITFVPTYVACAMLAFSLRLIPFQIFGPPSPTTWREVLVNFFVFAVPCVIAWIVMRLTYWFFRGLQIRR
jgi:hypothetical protein